jgi:hypothetical protein
VIFGASGVGVGLVVDPPQAAAHSAAPNAPMRNRIATVKPILEASGDSVHAGARSSFPLVFFVIFVSS